jgi:DNA-binding Lrp family transcriptional regulator
MKGDIKMNDNITMEVPYFQVPNDIFEIGLDKHELLVYMYLARCGNQGSKAFPSYNKIAEKTGISRRKVIDTIKILEDKMLLVKEKRYNFERGENYSNTYRVEHDVKSIGSAYHAPRSELYALCSEQDAPYKETDYKEIIKNIINVVAPKGDNIEFYNSIFNYYFDTYKKYMNKEHPLLSKKYVKQIVDSIDVFSDEYEILKVAEWESIIDMYFNSNLDCDRNMIHFAQPEILYNRADNCKLVGD